MSKERARRRAAREHEAAIKAAARAAEQERSERRAARAACSRNIGLANSHSSAHAHTSSRIVRHGRWQNSLANRSATPDISWFMSLRSPDPSAEQFPHKPDVTRLTRPF